MRWSNVIRGFFMGITEMLPGISSGTLMLLLGIYDQTLVAINELFTKRYKKSLMFLIPLFIGMGIAIVTMSSLINYMLNTHPIITHFFFLGLVIGVIPMMFKLGNYKVEFKTVHYSIIVVVTALLFLMDYFVLEKSDVTSVEMSTTMLMWLFICGFLGASALILPGLSGSVILLMLGAYPILMYSISEFLSFNFTVTPVLVAVGLGIIAGVLLTSRVLHYLLRVYPYLMYALIIGLLAGSVFPIFNGLPSRPTEWVISLIAFVLGLFISYYMSIKNNSDTI
ncbi:MULTISPECIES: DUF368 domain-containing protein [Nosocomiicoccus]|uniref:DUF368 domain-containing protein n=1 Tax=Nosocomiicoccus massiliensis TaxID=1232430 RepID=A0AAF0YLQ1_9STAP|nr:MULTISPECIES: DUF368 domain-containing protein [Nosocomiicoccus]WOS95754.1 DUF368 domain-containing protein [Nosocomiicoccus massiliensis]